MMELDTIWVITFELLAVWIGIGYLFIVIGRETDKIKKNQKRIAEKLGVNLEDG